PRGGAVPPCRRQPAELVDPAGRRAFLVVTDAAADRWYDDSAAGALAQWGRSGPVAILQPLPERLWSRTGLRPRVGRLHTTLPAAARSRPAGGNRPNLSTRRDAGRSWWSPTPPPTGGTTTARPGRSPSGGVAARSRSCSRCPSDSGPGPVYAPGSVACTRPTP